MLPNLKSIVILESRAGHSTVYTLPLFLADGKDFSSSLTT